MFVPGPSHIELVSGRYLDLADPDPAVITVEDVAHGLSHVCRYAGQTSRFYSVAEHALLVSRKLEAEGHDPAVQLAGLHHDDTEAFIGDITRPLKTLLPAYREIERSLGWAIFLGLALPRAVFMADGDAVKDADDWALACEAYHLLPSRGRGWFCEGFYDPSVAYDIRFPYDLLGQPPEWARDKWLERHRELVEAA